MAVLSAVVFFAARLWRMVDLGPPTGASVRNLLAMVGCNKQVFPPGTDHAHACLSAPAGQAEACARQMNTSNSWPNQSSLTAARDAFQNMSLLLVGDSTLENKQLFLQRLLHVNDSCKSGHGSCFISVGRHLTRTPKACPNIGGSGRTDFDVIVFNAGMHFLSPFYPNRPSFSQYWQSLRSCAQLLMKRYRRSRLVYMLTNRICENQWRGAFAAGAERMRGETETPTYTMQWSDIGVQSVRVAERELARELGWLLLDGHTADHCQCSGLKDGRHFMPLVPNFLARLATLARQAAPRNDTMLTSADEIMFEQYSDVVH